MIADTAKLSKLYEAWKRVRIGLEMIRTNQAMAHFHAAPLTADYRALSYNLVLVYAFAVLEGVLEALRNQGVFTCPGNGLSALMSASRRPLSWHDYAAVDDGRKVRNLVAHEGASLPPEECIRFVDSIERELVTWKVIPGPIRATYTIELKTVD